MRICSTRRHAAWDHDWVGLEGLTDSIQALREEFGSDPVSFYAADTFNEMKPPTNDPVYLTNITTAIYQVTLPPTHEYWRCCKSSG